MDAKNKKGQTRRRSRSQSRQTGSNFDRLSAVERLATKNATEGKKLNQRVRTLENKRRNSTGSIRQPRRAAFVPEAQLIDVEPSPGSSAPYRSRSNPRGPRAAIAASVNNISLARYMESDQALVPTSPTATAAILTKEGDVVVKAPTGKVVKRLIILAYPDPAREPMVFGVCVDGSAYFQGYLPTGRPLHKHTSAAHLLHQELILSGQGTADQKLGTAEFFLLGDGVNFTLDEIKETVVSFEDNMLYPMLYNAKRTVSGEQLEHALPVLAHSHFVEPAPVNDPAAPSVEAISPFIQRIDAPTSGTGDMPISLPIGLTGNIEIEGYGAMNSSNAIDIFHVHLDFLTSAGTSQSISIARLRPMIAITEASLNFRCLFNFADIMTKLNLDPTTHCLTGITLKPESGEWSSTGMAGSDCGFTVRALNFDPRYSELAQVIRVNGTSEDASLSITVKQGVSFQRVDNVAYANNTPSPFVPLEAQRLAQMTALFGHMGTGLGAADKPEEAVAGEASFGSFLKAGIGALRTGVGIAQTGLGIADALF